MYDDVSGRQWPRPWTVSGENEMPPAPKKIESSRKMISTSAGRKTEKGY